MRKHKERIKNLIKRWLDYLGLGDRDEEDDEENEVEEEMRGLGWCYAGRNLHDKGEDFGNLWTKLEEGKRKVIGGLDWQVKFC